MSNSGKQALVGRRVIRLPEERLRGRLMLMLTESLHHVFVWPSENRTPGASDHQKNNKKSPRGISPAVVLSPLVPSLVGTSTFNAPSKATPITPSNAIGSLPTHQSADGYLLPAWPRS